MSNNMNSLLVVREMSIQSATVPCARSDELPNLMAAPLSLSFFSFFWLTRLLSPFNDEVRQSERIFAKGRTPTIEDAQMRQCPHRHHENQETRKPSRKQER